MYFFSIHIPTQKYDFSLNAPKYFGASFYTLCCIIYLNLGSYKKVYEEYIKKHRVFIANVSNVRSKAKDGSYQTSIKNFKGVGYKSIPYNSSCISPILPFHNKRNGDEMQGFISIMSTKANAFKDKGIGNIEFERYLEFVSGLVYKVCVRNKSLNN